LLADGLSVEDALAGTVLFDPSTDGAAVCVGQPILLNDSIHCETQSDVTAFGSVGDRIITDVETVEGDGSTIDAVDGDVAGADDNIGSPV
jgi:hypothetical protein